MQNLLYLQSDNKGKVKQRIQKGCSIHQQIGKSMNYASSIRAA